MTDWSKLSSSIFSQGSDAFAEAQKRVSQAISQTDLDPQNIDWSKVSSNVVSRVSDALTEARQLVNQAAAQRDIDIQNVDQSKFLGNIVSSVTDVLTGAKRLVDQNVLAKDLSLTNVDWSRVLGNILSRASSALATAGRLVDQVFIYHNWRSAMAIMSQQYQEKLCPFIGVIFNISRIYWAKMWGSILPRVLFVLTEVNNLSIMHPYAAAVALILLSAFTNIGVFLTLSQLTGTIAVFLCLLPVRLIIWCLGFRSEGVAQGSFASAYQSSHYGGTVPRGSSFAHLQSTGATMWPVPLTLVSLLSYAGVAIVLGREWGWWFQ